MKRHRKASQSRLEEPLEQQEPKFQPTGRAIMVSESSDDFGEGCRHCGTTRHSLRKGRRCKYCDRLIQRRRRALRWRLDSPQTLKGCALVRSGMYPSPQELERYRANYLREIDKELKRRRYMEAKLHERVTGLDVEYMLRAVAVRAGAEGGDTLFHGRAGYLDAVFDAKAASTLYRLLYEIIEACPTRRDDKRLLNGVFSRMSIPLQRETGQGS